MTAWPIIFNFDPSSQSTPAISVVQGNAGLYVIKAIPDPNYPNTIPTSPLGGAAPLPPQPVVTSLTVTRGGQYDPGSDIWTMVDSVSARVSFNSNNIFPFKDISIILEDGTSRNFTTKAQVDNFVTTSTQNFLVTSCVPVSDEFVYKALTVTATSTSTSTPVLTRTFWIRMESDFTRTQTLLLDLLALSKPYIDAATSGMPPFTPFVPPVVVPTVKRPASEVLKHEYTAKITRNDMDEPEYVFDEIFRQDNAAEIIAKIEQETGKSIVELMDEKLESVVVTPEEGKFNPNIVPISDIDSLKKPDSGDDDCCTCDLP